MSSTLIVTVSAIADKVSQAKTSYTIYFLFTFAMSNARLKEPSKHRMSLYSNIDLASNFSDSLIVLASTICWCE